MSLQQPVKRRTRILINLEVLGVNVDGHEFLGLLFDVHLRADDAVKNFIPPFYEFGFFLGHGTGAGYYERG